MLCHVAELVTKVAVFLREHGSLELATLFAELGTSANRSANPQIADSSFYLRICGPNFLLQIFADLR